MKNQIPLTVLPIKDQLVICVTAAIDASNRLLEPFLHFDSTGRLAFIECRTKSLQHTEILRLNVGYNAHSVINQLGDNISVDVSYGEINFSHIYDEVMKIIPRSDQI